MLKIEHEGQIISIIYRNDDWVKGLNFITPDEMFVQVGSWWYDKGKKLASHIHNDFDHPAAKIRRANQPYVENDKKSSPRDETNP